MNKSKSALWYSTGVLICYFDKHVKSTRVCNFSKPLSTPNIKALAYFIELWQSFSLQLEKFVKSTRVCNWPTVQQIILSTQHRPVSLLYDICREPWVHHFVASQISWKPRFHRNCDKFHLKITKTHNKRRIRNPNSGI